MTGLRDTGKSPRTTPGSSLVAARFVWRAWERFVAYLFPLLAGVCLATRTPVPLLGADWWPLWTITWIQGCWLLRYRIRLDRAR